MNLLAMISLALILILIIGVATGLVVAMYRNYATGKQFRKTRQQRVKQIRLSRMLVQRRVDEKEYVSCLPIHELEQEIRNCETCTQLQQCDSVLKASKHQHSHHNAEQMYTFCPNDKRISQWSTTVV